MHKFNAWHFWVIISPWFFTTILLARGPFFTHRPYRFLDIHRFATNSTPIATPHLIHFLSKEIEEMIPKELLDFHVWSSPKNIPAFSYDYWTSKDYDGYRQRNMTVHLDEQIDSNEDMLTAWTHMARADIFIMSQSSFSMVPGYMNSNCVIFPSNIDAPLDNWMNGRDESRASASLYWVHSYHMFSKYVFTFGMYTWRSWRSIDRLSGQHKLQ